MQGQQGQGPRLEGCLGQCRQPDEVGLSVLQDNHSGVSIEMHDLLQEMAREIVRKESKEPGEHSRLWDAQDISHVFMKKTGTAKIEGIFLNISELRREIHLNPEAFEKMSNLKFLKIYNSKDSKRLEEEEEEECKVHVSHGLDFLPNGLRCLYWYRYPLENLPANFSPENLLLIELPHSNFRGLWEEAEPESIVGHLSSSSQFSMVTWMRLVNCRNLRSLPNNIDLRCLDALDLSDCSRLETFPEISRNIRHLRLHGTGIKQVPSTVEYLDRLVELDLYDCTELESLSTSICKLKRLESLDLSHCNKLKTFPEILEPMNNLEILELSWTAIEELPSSVDNLTALKCLIMENCANLVSLPQSLGKLTTLCEFKFSISSPIRQVLLKPNKRFISQGQAVYSSPSLSGMSSLSTLSATYCNLRQLPADLGRLSYLDTLDLSGNNFESIPASIKQITQLESLCIRNCRRLQSLPELPVSLHSIDASGCTSLENISSVNQLLFEAESLHHKFDFSYCSKLDNNERDPISPLRNRYFVEQVTDNHDPERPPRISICYQGGKIPDWFEYQSTGGSIKIPLLSNWLNHALLGFALCLVLEDAPRDLSIKCHCHFRYDCDDNSKSTLALESLPVEGLPIFRHRTELVLLVYDGKLYEMIAANDHRLTQYSYDAVLFNFETFPTGKVKKCRAIPLYAKDEEYNSRPGGGPSKCQCIHCDVRLRRFFCPINDATALLKLEEAYCAFMVEIGTHYDELTVEV